MRKTAHGGADGNGGKCDGASGGSDWAPLLSDPPAPRCRIPAVGPRCLCPPSCCDAVGPCCVGLYSLGIKSSDAISATKWRKSFPYLYGAELVGQCQLSNGTLITVASAPCASGPWRHAEHLTSDSVQSGQRRQKLSEASFFRAQSIFLAEENPRHGKKGLRKHAKACWLLYLQPLSNIIIVNTRLPPLAPM